MTPDVQAAANHLRTFLDDIDTCFRAAGTDPEAHRNAPVIIAPGYDLTIGDLHTLLAAIDQPEQQVREALTAVYADDLRPGMEVWTGSRWMTIVTIERDLGCTTCTDRYGNRATWTPEIPIAARSTPEPRHRPLTDEPCGHIPTQRGLDYLANRRQQHPRGAE